MSLLRKREGERKGVDNGLARNGAMGGALPPPTQTTHRCQKRDISTSPEKGTSLLCLDTPRPMDAEWALVEPFIPPVKRGGNKRRVSLRGVVEGLVSVLSTIISICGASREASPTAAIIDSQSAC